MQVLERKEHADHSVEKLAYTHDGMKLIAWLVKPRGTGPYPLVVWNHNSRLKMVDGQVLDETQDPTITLDSPPYPGVRENGWAWFVPECRGYAGSDGQRLWPLKEPFVENTLSYLAGRATDCLAGIDQILAARPEIRRDQVAMCGASHGGMVTLEAAARRPKGFKTAIVQAPGVFIKTEAGLSQIIDWTRRIEAPVLFQHFRKDAIIPLSVSEKAVAEMSRKTPPVRLKVDEDIPGVEGPFQFDPGNYELMIGDFMQALEAALPKQGK
jgi:pimeloyl-ACP methyl ester carboxylesterase